MTAIKFKEKYPQCSHLEGDALWDCMTEMALQGPNALTADPNREIHFHEPVELVNGDLVYIEDDSKTVWLNNKGEKIKYIAGIDSYDKNNATESYSFAIWDGKTMKYDK